MLYELRNYHCAPGRIGALNERFTNVTLKFFEKYGIEPVGFWTTAAISKSKRRSFKRKPAAPRPGWSGVWKGARTGSTFPHWQTQGRVETVPRERGRGRT